jgi:TolB-like protein
MATTSGLGAERPPACAPEPVPPGPEAVRAQLSRILRSPGFVHAPRRQQFLAFVVEETLSGRGEALKEFVIAAEVFGRRDTYDPTVDAAVRVEARRIRERLDGFYAAEGATDPLRLVLPVGTYVPTWHRLPAASPTAEAAGTDTPDPAGGPAAPAPPDAEASIRPSRRWSWTLTLLFLAVAVMVVGGMRWVSRPRLGRPSSLAVLPFAALDGDTASTYLASGLFEDLTAELGHIDGLTVIGRRSAATLRQRGMEAVDIGRELRVPAVLNGTVRREDGKVRITVQLVETASGRQLWADTYDRPWQELLVIQRDVAESVARAMAGQVGVPTRTAPGQPTGNAEAWDAYLQGRYQRGRGTREGLQASVPLFERAVALDPDYASAWAALGESLITMAFHGFTTKTEAVPRARAALDRAISLSPELATAHAARAWLALVHDWQWPDAERGFRRALTLDPGLARARQMFAFGLASRKRLDEAIAQSREAMALDPLAYAASTDFPSLLLFARRYDEALAHARGVLRLEPTSSVAHVVAGSALLWKGAPDAGILEFQLALDSANFSTVLGRLGYAYAASGRHAEARGMLQRIDTTFGDPMASPVERAYVYAGLGDHAAALAALDRAVTARDGEVIFLDVQPFFDGLRADPAFQALRARVGLDRN